MAGDRTQRLSLRALLASGLVLALLSALVTKESFTSLDASITLTTDDADCTVTIPAREPLYLEYALTVRAPGAERPAVSLEWNGIPVAQLPVRRLFVPEGGRILVPADAVTAGENRVRIVTDGAAGSTFELQARIHNYYGIAPDAPRAYVVADELVRHAASETTTLGAALRFGVFYLMSVTAIGVVNRLHRARARPARIVILAGPCATLGAVLAYGIATPRHIWLAPETLIAVAMLGWMTAVLAL